MTAKLTASKKYYLLLIDIKKSTVLSSAKRRKVFNRLDAKIQELNQQLSPKPLLKINISYGDEIAGLFEKPNQFYYIVSQLREEIFPDARFRYAVTYGKIGIVSKDIREVGGKIFKRADELIKHLKRQDLFCAWEINSENAILNSLCEMSNTIWERMTSYQRRVYQLLETGLNQKEIAKRLKKYPQSVSNAVKKGGADQVIAANKIINEILEKF